MSTIRFGQKRSKGYSPTNTPQMKRIMLIIFFSLVICSAATLKAQSPNLSPNRILLMPEPGKMHCNVVVRDPEREVFALTLPETIGCREDLLLNFPDTHIEWEGPDSAGRVSTSWTVENHIVYTLLITPFEDYIDARMEVQNLSRHTWHDVWAFHCMSPTRAPHFRDSSLTRTYISHKGLVKTLAEIEGIEGLAADLGRGLYLHTAYPEAIDYPFISDLKATRSDPTDGEYIVAVSGSNEEYIAAACPQALFIFHNPKFSCIHAAPVFGNIVPGESQTVTSRFYIAKGNLDTFLERYKSDFPD